MKRFSFNVLLGGKEVKKVADSNSKATAITMVVNKFSEAEREDITSIEIYAEKELKIKDYDDRIL